MRKIMQVLKNLFGGKKISASEIAIKDINNKAKTLDTLGIIIESGSNSNGSWIKYSDGRMECEGSKNSGIISWASDGGHFVKSGFTMNNFPQPFISPPIVIKTIESVNPNARYISINGGGTAPTSTNPGTYNLLTYWNASNTNVIVSYKAIGRWK